MFDNCEPVHYERRKPLADTVAFQFNSQGQSLPQWFDALVRLKRARWEDSGLQVQHITGKYWTVEIGQYVLLNGLGHVHVMDAPDFEKMYKEAT